jgi:hypothetical protein
MEEQQLFTRMHDALDVPTPPGAYERLRTQLTKKPVRQFRWPALQTRWSKMSFRFAAGLAIIAIVAAAAAAAVAIHNSTNNVAPAGSRMSIQAYQKMINSVAIDPSKWADPCDDTHHSGCASDAARSMPAIQRWLDALRASKPPERFVVVNLEMEQQLAQNLTELVALAADSRRGDDAAMTRDYDVAVYAAYWTSEVVPAIRQSEQADSQMYIREVRNMLDALEGCSNCQLAFNQLVPGFVSTSGQSFINLFDSIAPAYDLFEADLAKYAAPTSLAGKDAKLQTDLATANTVLLRMRVAAAASDGAGFNAAALQLKDITTKIGADAAQITG